MNEGHSAAGQPEIIRDNLALTIRDKLGQNVYLCYQCVKCTSGCPLVEFFDWQPNQIMRAVQLGRSDIALKAQTPWLCAACQACTTRCPQGLDINAVMEFLTREAVDRGIEPPVPEVHIFTQAFMRQVRLWGRSYEPGLMAEMKLRNLSHLFEDIDLYKKMVQKGKVSLIPKRGKPPRTVNPHPDAAGAVAYYPGCSLHATATEFNESVTAVAQALGLKLIEPQGWVCCGSSAAHRGDPVAANQLPLQNLAVIEQSGFKEVTMPCAACFNRHKAAQFEIRNNAQHKAQAEQALDYTFQDTVRVSTFTQSILNHVGLDELAGKIQKPLIGLRIVPYYGCLLTRPPQVTGAPNPENPTDMDDLLRALGAEVIDWSYKTSCCGAAHSLTRPDIVLSLSGQLIEHARLAGADLIAVACPLCHTNLDARQFQMECDQAMPVLYFTQLMALALDLPQKALLHKNLVDPRPILQKRAVLN